MTKIEELPEEKKVSFTIRKTQFWIGFLTILFIFIGSFIVYPIVYVQDKNYTLDRVVEESSEHEERLRSLELMLPKIDEVNKELKNIIEELKIFRTELNDSRQEWLRLFRDFDLRKKQ